MRMLICRVVFYLWKKEFWDHELVPGCLESLCLVIALEKFMKRSILLALTAVLFASLHLAPAQVTATLVEDDFAGSAGAAPDAARFTWGGEVSQNGGGFLNFSTDSANTSWL